LHLRPDAHFVDAWASKSKYARAEECVALYERSQVHHVGVLVQLEEQMTTPYDPSSGELTWDRVDALVWGLHALFFRRDREEHFSRARHVVAADRAAAPAYEAVAPARVLQWQETIDACGTPECMAVEYGAMRKVLQDAIFRYGKAKDPRGMMAMRALGENDRKFGREQT